MKGRIRLVLAGVLVLLTAPALRAQDVTVSVYDILKLASRADLDQAAFAALIRETLPFLPEAVPDDTHALSLSEQDIWTISNAILDPLKVPPSRLVDCVHVDARLAETIIANEQTGARQPIYFATASRIAEALADAPPLAEVRAILICDVALVQVTPFVTGAEAQLGTLFETEQQVQSETRFNERLLTTATRRWQNGPSTSSVEVFRLIIEETQIQSDDRRIFKVSFISFELMLRT